MTLTRNTEAYNLLKGLIESYGANSIRDTILQIVGTGDLSDPTHARHIAPNPVPYTIDERTNRRKFMICPATDILCGIPACDWKCAKA